MIKRIFSIFVILTFMVSLIVPPGNLHAQSVLNLPQPGVMVTTSPAYNPAIITGMTLYPDNPLRFDFLVDIGDDKLQGDALQTESNKLINYFMAALTVPEDEMWVNLSPYEKDRIIAEGLGTTEMGRDMLAQDYILKQLTASMTFPEEGFGKKFWNRIYEKAQKQFGTTEIPTNTFNKIWIIPERATVSINETSVFVIDSHLKVMLEEDYLALESNQNTTKHGLGDVTKDDIEVISGVSAEIVREILLPEIEREINEGKHFANLRQIYNSMILATWYKKNLNESLLGQLFANQNMTTGIDVEDKKITQKIYNQYVEAFQKGVYNYMREDYDVVTQEVIPRKYFSGGEDFAKLPEKVDVQKGTPARANEPHAVVRVDAAMLGNDDNNGSSPVQLSRRNFLRWGAVTAVGVAGALTVPTIVEKIGESLEEAEAERLERERIMQEFLATEFGQKASNVKAAYASLESVSGLSQADNIAEVTSRLVLAAMQPGADVDKVKAAYAELKPLPGLIQPNNIAFRTSRLVLAAMQPGANVEKVKAAYASLESVSGLSQADNIAEVTSRLVLAAMQPGADVDKVKAAYAELKPLPGLIRSDNIAFRTARLVLAAMQPGADVEKVKAAYASLESVSGLSQADNIAEVTSRLVLAAMQPGADVDKVKAAYAELKPLPGLIRSDNIAFRTARLVLAAMQPGADVEKVKAAYASLESVSELIHADNIAEVTSRLVIGTAIQDRAMLIQENPEYGGIDFNPNNLDLQQEGNQIEFRLPEINLENIPSNIKINGIQPVIINVTPIPTLYLLLGLKEDFEEQELSRL